MGDLKRILPPVPADEIRQLCVLPALWPDLLAWMDRRGLYPFRIPVSDDDLPTYGIGVKSERPAPDRAHPEPEAGRDGGVEP